MRSFAKDILVIWVAMLAITAQLFFGVVHITALWVASAGPVAQVEEGTTTYSFLEICSAGGLVSLADQDQTDEGNGQDRCPVCASAATSPLLEGHSPIVVALAVPDALFPVIPMDQLAAYDSEQSVFIRGPPSLFHSA